MIGELLGPYRIESELGAGGMGTVYLATVEGRAPGIDKGRKVALKVVHQHLLATPGFFKRFLREAEIGKSVRHGNVVRTLDVDATLYDGQQLNYIVMEYVEGQTLRDLLKELSVVPEQLCRHIAREVAQALAAIHATGVVHRDLKPENVLITAEEVVKLMDLGVARLQDEVIRLSQTGAFVGSVMYAAPEQFSGGGENVDGRADLYALGLTLYELSTAHHPFHDDDLRVTIRRQLNENPRSPATFNPQLSPFFEELLLNLLTKEREGRFPSAKAFIEILDQDEESDWWQERARTIRDETHQPLRRIQIPRETSLHGRDAEMARMKEVYSRVKDGRGQTVLIGGEAGIGKTRFVDEFVGELQREGEDPHFLFAAYPPGGAATAAGAFSTAYREHFGAEGLESVIDGYLGDTSILTPAFAALLRGESAPEGKVALNKESIQTVFIQVTRALAAEKPTVVLIDDLHFCPEEGLALFAAMTQALASNRVMLLGTARRGLPESWVANVERLDNAQRITLERLGPKDLAQLLIDAFGSERLAKELGFQISHKSDGNPFFVFEILRGLRESAHLKQQADGSWASTGEIRDIDIPSSVLDLIEARIADLEEEEKDLLDVAACCGFEFDPLLVATVQGLGQIPAMKRLARIEKKHRLVRSAGRKFVFDHHQVQEALYEGLPELLREPYHAALGDALEQRLGGKKPEDVDGAVAVDLCEHFLKGARGERALPYLDPALLHLSNGYLNAAAIELAQRALSVEGLISDERRARLLMRVGLLLGNLGNHAEEYRALEAAASIAEEVDDVELPIEVGRRFGWYFVKTADFARAEEICLQALQLARESNLPSQTRGVLSVLGAIYYFLGRFEDARAHYEESGGAWSSGNLGLVLSRLGRSADALEDTNAALSRARSSGDRLDEGHHLTNLGPIQASMGDLAGARESLETACTLSRQVGHRRDEAYGLHRLGTVTWKSGDPGEARRLFQEALELRREIGDRSGVAESLVRLGGLDIGDGQFDDARSHLAEAAEIATEVNTPGVTLLAAAYRTQIPGESAGPALDLRAEVETRVEHTLRMEIRYLLWQTTQDAAHLAEAHRLVLEARDHAPEQYRESMLENVPLHRDIVAAWKEHGNA